MESTLRYFTRKHRALKDDYKTENKVNRDSCIVIARALEKLLKNEGREPQLFWLRSKAKDDAGNRLPLVPKPYNGRLNDWKAHIITIADNIVFDPMLPQPVKLNEYPTLAFEIELDINPLPY